jgi:hypothetical protein
MLSKKKPILDRSVVTARERALSHGAYRLRDLRRLIEAPTAQPQLAFMQHHPLIRDMREYGAFLESLQPSPQPIKEPTP